MIVKCSLLCLMAVGMMFSPLRADETKKVNTVAHAELKAWLPGTMLGIKRKNAESMAMDTGEVKMSHATGSYAGEDGNKEFKVQVIDPGVLELYGAAAAWDKINIEQDSDTELTKTVTWKGSRGFQQYNKQDKSGQFHLIVGRRFVVVVEGSDVTLAELEKAMESLDLKKLEGLAK